MSGDWLLAQINIGRLIAPQGDPRLQPFFDALDRINALADESPGFVWRLQDDDGNAMGISYSSDPLLNVNMSVWESADALFDFVYRSAHTSVMAKRRDYFQRFDGHYQALWWVPAGTLPSVNDGLSRLWLLDQTGPSPQAFTFKTCYPQPDHTPGAATDFHPDPWCAGHA